MPTRTIESTPAGFTSSDYVFTDHIEVASCHIEEDAMHIHDPVWGDEYIGDEKYDKLLVDLAREPLFRRLQAVEQLTLPASYTTIPNTSQFSRWQHIWGSLVLVRKMTKHDDRFSERDRIVLQLRTLFSDVGQTAFSHLGDWIFQDAATHEDLHDQELRELLESFDIHKMLEEHDITLDETVFPDIKDWVECPSPDLCVDRVDYGLREILRWMSPPSPMHMHKYALNNPKDLFHINDNAMLEIKNETFAHDFAYAYNLLPTEHWAQPVHRLQLLLMQAAVKNVLLDESDITSPRDMMYGIDANFFTSFQRFDNATLSDTMESIGRAQRRIYTHGRSADLHKVLRMSQPIEFPDPLTSYDPASYFTGLVAPQVEIEPAASIGAVVSSGGAGIVFGLPTMKMRSIDPTIMSAGGERLSQTDEDYAAFLAGQSEVMSKSYNARLLVNKETAGRLSEILLYVDREWRDSTKRPRDIEALRLIVGHGAVFSTLHGFDTVSDNRPKYL